MLEFFAYRKFKKNKAEKAAKAAAAAAAAASDDKPSATTEPESESAAPSAAAGLDSTSKDESKPETNAHSDTDSQPDTDALTLVLRKEDESFLHSLVDWEALLSSSDDDISSRPPLPPRPSADTSPEPGDVAPAEVDKQEKKKNRFSALFHRDGKNKSLGATPTDAPGLVIPESAPPEPEDVAAREASELAAVLDNLNLSAQNNRAFSMSAESAALVRQFTLALQDLVNGVPTAVDDIKRLVDDRDGTLAKSYDKLPAPLKKLVKSMPTKVTDKLAPEVAAAAAQSQGVALDVEGKAAKAVAKEAAKKIFTSVSLTELVTKPAAIIDMLKAILGALKLRWPAFIGTNAVMSVALFLLLFVLWYCHKRGKEVRLEKEEAEAKEAADAEAAAMYTVADEAPPTSPIIETPPSPVVAEDPQKLLEAPPKETASLALNMAEEKELTVSK